jgi:hypothetical protein
MNMDKTLLTIAFLLSGSPIVFLLVNFNKIPPMVPWFYSLPWGEERLIQKEWMIGFFGAVVGLTAVNLLVSRLFANDLIARRLVLTAGVVMNLLWMITFVEIMKIVQL